MFVLIAGARHAVQYIEALDYFMVDMKNSCLFRYRNISTGSATHVVIDCTGACLAWIVIQLAFAIIVNNITIFVVPDDDDDNVKNMLRGSVESLDRGRSAQDIIFSSDSSCHHAHQRSYIFYYTPLHHHRDTGRVIIPSIIPSITQLLHKEIQTITYLQDKYGPFVQDLMDEFDLLGNEERDQFVAERSAHLLSRVRQSSGFYARTLRSDCLAEAPIITGQTLLEV